MLGEVSYKVLLSGLGIRVYNDFSDWTTLPYQMNYDSVFHYKNLTWKVTGIQFHYSGWNDGSEAYIEYKLLQI